MNGAIEAYDWVATRIWWVWRRVRNRARLPAFLGPYSRFPSVRGYHGMFDGTIHCACARSTRFKIAYARAEQVVEEIFSGRSV